MNRMAADCHTFELMDFSDEILLEIFANFNDIDLLNASQVCRRFNVIAKEIFAKKYNGDSNEKYYDITVYSTDTEGDQKMYRKFLKAFGNEIGALNFTSKYAPNRHELLKLIGQHCRSVKYLTINGKSYEFNLLQMIKPMSKLTKLTIKDIQCTNLYWTDIRFAHLTTFVMEDVGNIDVQMLKQFLYINPQLEHLRIADCRRFPLKVIQPLRNHMKKLKSLQYGSRENSFGRQCRDINMEQLESLKITLDASSFQTVLEAIARGSKQIQSLDILIRDEDDSLGEIREQIDEVIPLFEKLTTLRLRACDLTLANIRILIRLMPHLVTLQVVGVQLYNFHPDDILFIFKRCKHMKELVLESESEKMDTENLNLEFHRQFTECVQNRGCDVKFELIQPETVMTITAQKIIKNKILVYQTLDKPLVTQSTVHFLDLNDECLNKIYSYLDEQSERALYETCTRTKKAMREKILNQVFTVVDVNSAKDTFRRFGEHINKLAIDINTNNRKQTAATWSFIGTELSEKLTELSVINIKVDAVDSLTISFPNVTTLKIMSVVSSRTHIFPPMNCPKLSQIEFHEGDIIFKTKASNFGVSLQHLTTIKVNCFSKSIVNILHSLDDKICDQLREFIVETQNSNDPHLHYTNIAMRFRNLTTLILWVASIETANTKYLFASCTKLVKLSMGYVSCFEMDDWRRTLRHIKENCKHLEEIRLIRYNYGFDQTLLAEIARTLPKVKLYTVCYDRDYHTYKVEAFRKTTKDDRIKPF